MSTFAQRSAAAIAALTLPVAALAVPATESHTSNLIALQDTDWDDQLVLQQYAGTGTLTGVTVELFGSLAGNIVVESTDKQASTLTVTLASTISLALPTLGSPSLSVAPQYAKQLQFSAFDGTEDFAGTSGTELNLSTPVQRSASLSFSDSASLALFTGNGTLNLAVMARDGSTTSGAANFTDGYASQAGAYARVTYTYVSAPVPEPGTWALMFAGLGMVGTLAARRRVG
ncbi:choice-of-anchor E domain-containing protein [Ideonella sp. DXS22W]|uniref:Choice-of-anchor E domain-containing protein n=1 Tax=Pseudaquabacterium inlustre TaxID=2984192 RepID=A0ABU9CHC6_9BURK